MIDASPSDVESRLALYNKIRRIRASTIQIFSNAGQDQAERVKDEVVKFIPAEKVPSKSLTRCIGVRHVWELVADENLPKQRTRRSTSTTILGMISFETRCSSCRR
jgi:hypothetical protein